MRNRARIRGLCDQTGQVLALAAVTMIVLLGVAGFAIDAGRAWFTQRELQRALDAAALAAAQDLPDMNAANITAREYGPEPGGKNPLRIANGVTLDVEPRCVTSIKGPCQPFNALHVSATATVPTTFAKLLGFDTLEVKAQATACSPCIDKKKLDIVMVLDRTGSMCQFSNGQNDPNCTDLNNAKEGIRTFLRLMDPTVHNVGLAVLPPKPPTAACSTSPPSLSWYDNVNSQYVLVGLSNNYQNANGTLNTSSALVSTVNCIAGGGRTAYANAIDAAWQELQGPRGRADAQDIVIFLSDGAANYGPNWYPNSSPYRATPCRQGVTSAGWAKDGGALVYSIGYDLNGSGTDFEQCHTAWWTGGQNNQLEQPPITSWDAIRAIATDSSTFYNKPDPGQLNTIFTAIATDIGARFSQLIDDNAQ